MSRITVLDSTLRDGAQGEGISFSVTDKLNIVRGPGRARRRPHRGGQSRDRIPRTSTSSKRRGASGSSTRPSRPSARRGARGGSARRTRPQKPPRGRYAGRRHLRQELGPPRRAGSQGQPRGEPRHDSRHRSLLQGGRAGASSTTPSISSTASRPTGLRAHDPAGRGRGGAECLVLCDTNGGSLPDAVGELTARVVKEIGLPRRHPRAQRLGPRRGQFPRRRSRRGRCRSRAPWSASARGAATPTSPR